MENFDLMNIEQEFNVSDDLTQSAAAMFCSIANDTPAAGRMIYNALGTSTRLADMIGKVLEITDVIAEPTLVNRPDGTQGQVTRVILIDTEGHGYSCVSQGIYNAVKRLIGVFGLPHWSEPLPLQVKQVQRRGQDGQPRNVLTLELM